MSGEHKKEPTKHKKEPIENKEEPTDNKEDTTDNKEEPTESIPECLTCFTPMLSDPDSDNRAMWCDNHHIMCYTCIWNIGYKGCPSCGKRSWRFA